MSSDTLKRLDLVAAIEAEADTTRNLVPPEPGWDRLVGSAEPVARYIENLCRQGLLTAPELALSSRKPGHGVRPVPYWGVVERVLYRALTAAALRDLPALDRSREAYLSFVKAPVDYGWELQRREDSGSGDGFRSLFYFLQSPVKYIVKSDLTSFYQFVDHSILADELLAQGCEYDVVEPLIDLLGEVQGRSYGLPQLLDASDALSEVYVDRVERSLIQRGYAVWRFNDDFRIACMTYVDAVAAIEALDGASRAVGLAINESKTLTYGFTTYMVDTLGLTESEVGETIALDDVEVAVGDYTDDFSGDVDAALQHVQSAKSRSVEEGDINLRRIQNDQVRLLRRAIDALARAEDARAIPTVTRLLIYVPSLTPSLIRYLLVFKSVDEQLPAVAKVLDELITKASLNDWQRVWLLYAIRELALIAGDESALIASRAAWVDRCYSHSPREPLSGNALRTLAASGRIELSELIERVAAAPQAMLTTYLTAVLEATGPTLTDEHARQVAALMRTNELSRALLEG